MISLIVYVVLGLIGLLLLFLLLHNWHKQREFEESGHVVPEDYD